MQSWLYNVVSAILNSPFHHRFYDGCHRAGRDPVRYSGCAVGSAGFASGAQAAGLAQRREGLTMAATTTPRLALRGITKQFGDHKVLKGVDLTVAPRRIYCYRRALRLRQKHPAAHHLPAGRPHLRHCGDRWTAGQGRRHAGQIPVSGAASAAVEAHLGKRGAVCL